MRKNFRELSRNEQEDIVMPEILYILKQLGGYASRKEIKSELKTTSELIPEEVVDLSILSKNNTEYKPFDFIFNFSISNLEFAKFISKPDRGNVQLTEKGRSFDLDKLDIQTNIRDLASPIWEERSKKNKERKNKKKDLNEDISKDSEEEIEEIMEEMDSEGENWKKELANALNKMSPSRFETFSRALVRHMGVDIDEKIGTKVSGDGGLDGFGYIKSDDFRTTRVAIQAKRWLQGNVSSPEIDKFRGAMDKFNAEYGIFITTSDFTREAIKASRYGTRIITLINGEDIIDLVEKYELYLTPVKTYILDSFYYEED